MISNMPVSEDLSGLQDFLNIPKDKDGIFFYLLLPLVEK